MVPGLTWLPRNGASWHERSCESNLERAPWKTGGRANSGTREGGDAVPSRDFGSEEPWMLALGGGNTLAGWREEMVTDPREGGCSTGRAGSGPSQRLSVEFTGVVAAPGQCFLHVRPRSVVSWHLPGALIPTLCILHCGSQHTKADMGVPASHGQKCAKHKVAPWDGAPAKGANMPSIRM